MAIEFPKLIPRQLPPHTERHDNDDDFRARTEELKEDGYNFYASLNTASLNTPVPGEEIQKDPDTFIAMGIANLKRINYEYIIIWHRKTVSIWLRSPENIPQLQKLIAADTIKVIKED